jgi:hypothetical protein
MSSSSLVEATRYAPRLCQVTADLQHPRSLRPFGVDALVDDVDPDPACVISSKNVTLSFRLRDSRLRLAISKTVFLVDCSKSLDIAGRLCGLTPPEIASST